MLFDFKEREREGERAGEKHGSVALLSTPTTDKLQPQHAPDWESNLDHSDCRTTPN